MPRWPLLDRLSDPAWWRTSTVVRDLLVTDIAHNEAAQLAAPGRGRDIVERFIEAHRVLAPSLRGVLLFVVGTVDHVGFIEVHPGDSGVHLWNGPHGPWGPLFPSLHHRRRS